MDKNKKKPIKIEDQTLKDLEEARNPNFTEEEVSKTKRILDRN